MSAREEGRERETFSLVRTRERKGEEEVERCAGESILISGWRCGFSNGGLKVVIVCGNDRVCRLVVG